MNAFLDHLSANDNDIYDLIISGKQRLTETVLRDFLRDRGIFCSPEDDREQLADYISILPHGYHDVAMIMQKREPHQRRDKTTSVRLNVLLPMEELKAAAAEYANEVGSRERVTHRPAANGSYVVSVAYDEYNRTKTRLLQREKQDAEIEFLVQDGQTIVRLPATEKAQRIIATLKNNVERSRKEHILTDAIELIGITSAELRSRFFTQLISQVPGLKLINVMSLKVSSERSEDGEEDNSLDFDEQDQDQEGADALMFAAVVHSMHLSGQNLVQSQEYKDLTKRGFYITAISWRAEIQTEPPDIIQFEAGFQDRKQGKGFKYSVTGAFRAHKGTHRKTIVPVLEAEKASLFASIESTARKIITELQSVSAGGAAVEGDSDDPL
ncbi:hypothetical protein [Duganella vulcania]|uniref:Uncharacterized protein n=1 Tax=Duganella vulcania TaxID=2692166 RepID=A0A845GQY1_9BURK|nr:hypothetical protein [Duganella vulcania]MYM96401.1 hypothetical protein [Duganella vulcania]